MSLRGELIRTIDLSSDPNQDIKLNISHGGGFAVEVVFDGFAPSGGEKITFQGSNSDEEFNNVPNQAEWEVDANSHAWTGAYFPWRIGNLKLEGFTAGPGTIEIWFNKV